MPIVPKPINDSLNRTITFVVIRPPLPHSTQYAPLDKDISNLGRLVPKLYKLLEIMPGVNPASWPDSRRKVICPRALSELGGIRKYYARDLLRKTSRNSRYAFRASVPCKSNSSKQSLVRRTFVLPDPNPHFVSLQVNSNTDPELYMSTASQCSTTQLKMLFARAFSHKDGRIFSTRG